MAETPFRNYRFATILIFGVFALWSVSQRVYDTLVPEFAKVFHLSSPALVLSQSVCSICYVFLAIPAALYARTFSSKSGMVFGLGCWSVGAFLFYPAAEQKNFLFLLLAAFVISSGWILVEMSVCPVVARLGSPEGTTRRLNFAYALCPIGVLMGLYIGRWLILSNLALPIDRLGTAVVRPYMVMGLLALLLAFLTDKVKFPPLASERHFRGAITEIRALLARPLFVAAIAAQFANIAAQAGTLTMMMPYVREMLPGVLDSTVADLLLASLIVFAIGRFVGAALMYLFAPERMLALFAASGLVLTAIAAASSGTTGVYALVTSSFSMSIMFATILGLAISDLGPLTKAGTALVYTGGAAGGVSILMMHLVWTVSSIQLAMIVPMLGFLGVLSFALMSQKKSPAKPITTAAHAAE